MQSLYLEWCIITQWRDKNTSKDGVDLDVGVENCNYFFLLEQGLGVEMLSQKWIWGEVYNNFIVKTDKNTRNRLLNVNKRGETKVNNERPT